MSLNLGPPYHGEGRTIWHACDTEGPVLSFFIGQCWSIRSKIFRVAAIARQKNVVVLVPASAAVGDDAEAIQLNPERFLDNKISQIQH